ncbi:MAG: ImmA/IrrE family metallo-endopeptidase [Gammaproteobacteria bacterium]
MSTHSVIAANLARLRADRGMSQEELAQAAKISRVSLSKIERGAVVPRSKTLTDLAKALNASLRDLVTAVDVVPNVRFRADKRVNNREQILAEVSAWLAAYRWLESELDDKETFKLLSLVGQYTDPVVLAQKARAKLGLGEKEPVRDICGLLEDNGVKVLLLKKATDAFFGLSVGPNDGGPAVVVNTWDRISVERWIFTAAHELGHILLHKEAFDCRKAEEAEQEEREADLFASNFLMPEAGFDEEWQQTYGLPFLQRVLKVKRIYRVSYKTVLYRLKASGNEDESVWKVFQVQHRMRFGKTLKKIDEPDRLEAGEFRFQWPRAGEPDGLSESDFLQDRLHRLVRIAFDRGAVSMGRAAELLRISRDDMRELAASWAG